jgi:hypothetical protein
MLGIGVCERKNAGFTVAPFASSDTSDDINNVKFFGCYGSVYNETQTYKINVL